MKHAGHRIWTPHRESERLVQSLLERALNECAEAQAFQSRLLDGCAIRLRDIVEHIAAPADVKGYEEAGWKQVELGVWRHFGGSFPDILQRNNLGVAFKVESVDRFTRSLGVDAPVEGAQHGPYRRVRAFSAPGAYFDAVERHGWAGVDAPVVGARRIERARWHQQMFRARPRPYRRAGVALSMTKRLATAAIADLGKHWACALFMRAEREYWAGQCEASALQRRRQDKLGVGWCNIDHYAYRCSREHFDATLSLFDRLGFERRELVYAGAKAGRGAQILEQPALRSAVLVEVDMTPDDLARRASPGALPPLGTHNQIGVWTTLNGESILEGGPSHIGGLYDGRLLQEYLQREDVAVSARSSEDAHLCRMRTFGQRRAIDPKRVEGLERSGHVAAGEADELRYNGVEAAQFECLERIDGFKGFAQGVIEQRAQPRGRSKTSAVVESSVSRARGPGRAVGRLRASRSASS